MKIRVLIGLLALSFAFSCQQKGEAEQKPAEETAAEKVEEIVLAKDAIQLANLTDENWKNGVGTTLNMLLVNYSKEKFDLIQAGHELHLPDGQIIKYFASEKAGDFIQIKLLESAVNQQAAVEYPNEITVK